MRSRTLGKIRIIYPALAIWVAFCPYPTTATTRGNPYTGRVQNINMSTEQENPLACRALLSCSTIMVL